MMKHHLFLRILAAGILSILFAMGLPGRARADIYVVTNTNNSGPGSLRQAMDDANINPGLDFINFDIDSSTEPGCNAGTGVCTIQPSASLPTITDPIYIDGLIAQTGASAGDLWGGTPHNLKIELDGSLLSPGSVGLYITAGGSTVQGLVIHSFPFYGIFMDTAGSNTIRTNYIGTDVNGVGDLGNGESGIGLADSDSNTIGGSSVGAANLISGNGTYGIEISGGAANANLIQGNFIGTDVYGEQRIANGQSGILLSNAPWNTIGGDSIGERNLISGNTAYGVLISGSGSVSNTVQGNYIGTAYHGTTSPYDVGNTSTGVHIASASYNTIGGSAAGEGNLIAGNGGDGVQVHGVLAQNNDIHGNLIGTDKNGAASIGNGGNGVRISNGSQYNEIGGDTPGEGNLISSNGSNGVLLEDSGTAWNEVAGNKIGTNIAGDEVLNNIVHGVKITTNAHHNTIGGDTSLARNLISGNNFCGVVIEGLGADNNLVKANYIGTDITGTFALPNMWHGIVIEAEAQGNTIGGTTPGKRNIISGNNEAGVWIGTDTSNNFVQGNYIGVDAAGSSAIPNARPGVFIAYGAHDNTVGGATSAHRNVISGNGHQGVQIMSDSTSGNTVLGNYIGLDASGIAGIGNTMDGVRINSGALNNTIGPGNTIAFNVEDGVEIGFSNTMGNVVTSNSIFTNGGKGIALYDGAHGGIPAPIITGTSFASMTVSGNACSSCVVEVFANPDTDGEGKIFLGSTTATGGGTFTLTVGGIPASYLTATATDASDGTSEFSGVFTSSFGSLYLPVILR